MNPKKSLFPDFYFSGTCLFLIIQLSQHSQLIFFPNNQPNLIPALLHPPLFRRGVRGEAYFSQSPQPNSIPALLHPPLFRRGVRGEAHFKKIRNNISNKYTNYLQINFFSITLVNFTNLINFIT